jgi:hypothetical protein
VERRPSWAADTADPRACRCGPSRSARRGTARESEGCGRARPPIQRLQPTDGNPSRCAYGALSQGGSRLVTAGNPVSRTAHSQECLSSRPDLRVVGTERRGSPFLSGNNDVKKSPSHPERWRAVESRRLRCQRYARPLSRAASHRGRSVCAHAAGVVIARSGFLDNRHPERPSHGKGPRPPSVDPCGRADIASRSATWTSSWLSSPYGRRCRLPAAPD